MEALVGRRPDGNPLQKWDIRTDVLSTRSFPGTSILRGRKNRVGNTSCSCEVGEQHRTYFDLCRSVVAPSMRNDLPIPEVKVCWNARNLFEDKIPSSYRLARKDGRAAKPVLFKDLTRMTEVHHVLLNGTYWFPRLIGKTKVAGSYRRSGMAILRLLAGLRSYSGKENIGQLCSRKVAKGAIHKLRQILATVDGVVMQLCLTFPDKGEYQNWSRIDQVTSCLIGQLTADHFADCRDTSRITAFDKLKKLRKVVKMKGFNPIGDLNTIDIPREMSFFRACLGFIGDRKAPIDMFRIATLSQTRASGVPPRVVYFRVLKEIKEVLTAPPDPSLYDGIAGDIQFGVDQVHMKVLGKLGSESERETFWRNCLDKAKISLSDSGEFFHKSSDGGKLEAAREVLSGLSTVPKRNLSTGEIESYLDVQTSRQGEVLFHWALDQFSDDETCYDRNLMSVRISLVAELGKYRGITVSHLAHAVLLHVLSHVLLEYLSIIPSSHSGVKAANHAWNFFKRLSHKNPCASFIFGSEDVYLFSTDWEQATNYCDHTVAQAMINRLCSNLGVPDWYRETCIFALCAPRQVEFMDPENKTLECFFTTRGELMGDPVVKVILHLYHLVGREIAAELLDQIYSGIHHLKSDDFVVL